MKKLCSLLVTDFIIIYILTAHYCESADDHGAFFASSSVDVHEKEILTKHRVNSRFQCLHRCRRNTECVDIAMKGEDTCYLLKNHTDTTAQVVDDVERISPSG